MPLRRLGAPEVGPELRLTAQQAVTLVPSGDGKAERFNTSSIRLTRGTAGQQQRRLRIKRCAVNILQVDVNPWRITSRLETHNHLAASHGKSVRGEKQQLHQPQMMQSPFEPNADTHTRNYV